MDLNEAKNVAVQLLNNAQVILERDKNLHPVLFAINNEECVTPIMVRTASKEDKKNLSDLMKEKSEVSDVLIFLQDAYLKWVDKPTAKIDKDDEDTYTALVAMVYTKEGSSMKQIMYVRHGDSFSYCTEDWVDYNPVKGVMRNPFIQKDL